MREDILDLIKGENGERVNLKRGYKWILNKMSYNDFRAAFVLRCVSTNPSYPFIYKYMVMEEDDSPKAREEYLKYLMYKLVQNIETPSVKLMGAE